MSDPASWRAAESPAEMVALFCSAHSRPVVRVRDRERRPLTYRELSALTGIPQATLERIAQGRSTRLGPILRRLLEAAERELMAEGEKT